LIQLAKLAPFAPALLAAMSLATSHSGMLSLEAPIQCNFHPPLHLPYAIQPLHMYYAIQPLHLPHFQPSF
jgi:hypothetical protein